MTHHFENCVLFICKITGTQKKKTKEFSAIDKNSFFNTIIMKCNLFNDAYNFILNNHFLWQKCVARKFYRRNFRFHFSLLKQWLESEVISKQHIVICNFRFCDLWYLVFNFYSFSVFFFFLLFKVFLKRVIDKDCIKIVHVVYETLPRLNMKFYLYFKNYCP